MSALRRVAEWLLAADERLERSAPRDAAPWPLEPRPDSHRDDERLFELRNRILSGYY